MSKLVSPSLLSANFLKLGEELDMLNKSEADWLHLDIMDGVFVPNISYGFPIIKQIRKQTDKPLDTHLMIVDPDRYIDAFKEAGVDILTVHYEACTHLHRTLQKIRSLGMKAGVALNPHTPVSHLEYVTQELDLVLIMSVNPGFGGQKFIEKSVEKIRDLKQLLGKKGSSALIQVDGGVDTHNAQMLYEAGADVLVAGNAIFASANPSQTITLLKEA